MENFIEKLEYLISRFNQIKHTYPNLANLWINYLSLNKNYLHNVSTENDIILKANNTLELISNYKDFSRENILILIWLSLHT